MSIRQAQMPAVSIPKDRAVNDLSGVSATKDPKAKAKNDREKVGELVGSIFYNTLIKQMQNSSMKSKMFHGGRGEEAFNGQLSAELSTRIGRSKQEPVSNAIYRAMAHRGRS
jgi:Rod binding domain-containing protein